MIKITLEFTNKRAAEVRRTLIERYSASSEATLEHLCHVAIGHEVHAQYEDDLRAAEQALEKNDGAQIE